MKHALAVPLSLVVCLTSAFIGQAMAARAVTRAVKNCWSAGYATGAGGATTPIMEHLRKGKFGLVRTPIAHAELEGLSCPTSRRCWVVGSVTKGTRTVPVIERWNGRKWSTVHATD